MAATASPGGAALGALGDPTRRRLLALVAGRERSVGELVELMAAGGAISQPAVSQHLRLLLEAGLVAVRADGVRRRYRIDPTGVAAASAWLEALVPAGGVEVGLDEPFGQGLGQALDALETEVARGRSVRRRGQRQGGAGRSGRAAS